MTHSFMKVTDTIHALKIYLYSSEANKCVESSYLVS